MIENILRTNDDESEDEILDNADRKIKENEKRHQEEMRGYEEEIKELNRCKEERNEREKAYIVLRERLVNEVTRDVVKDHLERNMEYMKEIFDGSRESQRRTSYLKGGRSRHLLLYSQIFDPFPDNQVDMCLEELSKVGYTSLCLTHSFLTEPTIITF